jgi:signal transduction histidine kinase
MSASASQMAIQAVRLRPLWNYIGGLAPVIFVWLVLVCWLAALLYNQASWSTRADEAMIEEWIEEARNFRKTLPELVKEYVRLQEEQYPARVLQDKRDELEEQLQDLAEPTRAYLNQLPGFPVIYRLEVRVAVPNQKSEMIFWDSPLPRPRQQNKVRVQVQELYPFGPEDRRAVIRCEYQLHAFNKLQLRDRERQRVSLVAGAVLLAATLLAGLFVYRFLSQERAREIEQFTIASEAEHRERELLETQLKQEEAERQRQELARKLLEKQLDAAGLERRVADAERQALEMKSQLYASIGIMAGSYAHNIKNLLVRPNDLISRCLDSEKVSPEQSHMLEEVRSTLGTVTERLQQILKTVRRDPNKSEMTRIDLVKLVREMADTWTEMSREKWKLLLSVELPTEPVYIQGDLSHLQQTIENLLFNARDATFEMRNHFREAARKDPAQDNTQRKQRLIEAAGWKGAVMISVKLQDELILLDVRDNGVGMSEEVRRNCLRTHFTTKRDNALYEGYSAGMGLGLSFVAVVLEHHRAELEIQSEPLKGALFRIRFPRPGKPS